MTILRVLTLLNACARNETRIAGRRGDKKARRVEEAPALWHRPQALLSAGNMSSVAALAGAEDLVTGLVLGLLAAGERCRRLQNDARKLGAGNPRQRRLVLVLAADLEQVKEVGGRGVNSNQVLIGLGRRSGQLNDLELFWALDTTMSMVLCAAQVVSLP